ncbi:MAG: LamG domain-containing protein [Bacteroidetes bacterium]|nr:LamG domain-containing protein [Bacteroidota bacterium]
MKTKITFKIAKGIMYVFCALNFIFLTFNCSAQGGAAINTNGAAAVNSAMLDVSSTNQGIRIPKVALTSSTSPLPITNPVNSLLVYDSITTGDITPGYYYWDATASKWVKLATGSGWQLTGNAGTDSSTNYIGTTDARPLVIKTNNAEKMRIMANGNVGIGTSTPTSALTVNGGALINGTTATATITNNLVSYYKLDGNSNDAVGSNNGTGTDIRYDLFENSDGTEAAAMNIFNSVNWGAQTFTTTSAYTITSVKLHIYRLGNPGNCTISIRATDVNGKPTGSDLTSTTFNGNSLTTSDVETEITFTPVSLSASTMYAIVARAISGDGSNILKLSFSYNTYSGGTMATSTDGGVLASNWTLNNYDWRFKIFGVGTSGKINQGAGFNGTTSNISGSSVGVLPTNSTLSCWIKTTQVFPGWNYIFGLTINGTNKFFGFISQGSTGYCHGRITDSNGIYADISSINVVNDGNWHFLALVKTGSSIEYFIDNVSQGTASASFTGNFDSMFPNFGGLGTYAGLLDECGYWSRALSSAEVSELYNSGSGLSLPPASPPALTVTGGSVGIGTTTPGSKLSVVGLPTSAAGLSSGDIWRNGSVLNIVP